MLTSGGSRKEKVEKRSTERGFFFFSFFEGKCSISRVHRVYSLSCYYDRTITYVRADCFFGAVSLNFRDVGRPKLLIVLIAAWGGKVEGEGGKGFLPPPLRCFCPRAPMSNVICHIFCWGKEKKKYGKRIALRACHLQETTANFFLLSSSSRQSFCFKGKPPRTRGEGGKRDNFLFPPLFSPTTFSVSFFAVARGGLDNKKGEIRERGEK